MFERINALLDEQSLEIADLQTEMLDGLITEEEYRIKVVNILVATANAIAEVVEGA